MWSKEIPKPSSPYGSLFLQDYWPLDAVERWQQMATLMDSAAEILDAKAHEELDALRKSLKELVRGPKLDSMHAEYLSQANRLIDRAEVAKRIAAACRVIAAELYQVKSRMDQVVLEGEALIRQWEIEREGRCAAPNKARIVANIRAKIKEIAEGFVQGPALKLPEVDGQATAVAPEQPRRRGDAPAVGFKRPADDPANSDIVAPTPNAEPGSSATTNASAAVPESGPKQADQPGAQSGHDPFAEHAARWPDAEQHGQHATSATEHAGGHPIAAAAQDEQAGATDPQSASAPARPVEDATTIAQGAEALDGSTTNIEYTDTAASAGGMVMGGFALSGPEPAEWKPKGAWRRVWFFGQSQQEVERHRNYFDWLKYYGAWLLFRSANTEPAIRQLAVGGRPGFAVALHVSTDPQTGDPVYTWWLYTNFGYHAVLLPTIGLPDLFQLGWNAANQVVQVRMLNGANPLIAAWEHYKDLAREHTERGEPYGLVGAVTTLELSTELADLIRTGNDHLTGQFAIPAPDVAQAEHFTEVPAPEQTAHALALADPDLYARLDRHFRAGQAEQVRSLVPDWIANCVGIPSAKGKEGFDAIGATIRAGNPVGDDLRLMAEADAHEAGVRMWPAFETALTKPEEQRPRYLLTFQLHYQLHLALLALKRWQPTQHQPPGCDPRFIFDVAYYAAKIFEIDHRWLYNGLPDDPNPYQ